jgi:calcineurin-like phosphoesterase family protein
MAENVFFTADTHLGHERLLSLGRDRPFASAEEMTEALVEAWNARVGRNDRIYHLSDWSFLSRPYSVNLSPCPVSGPPARPTAPSQRARRRR